jgi:uncharacterized protein
MRKYYFLLFIIVCFHTANSQVKKPAVVSKSVIVSKPAIVPKPGKPLVLKSRLFALARATKTEIMIRWAPTDFSTWKQCNQYGYVIERYTITRNNQILSKFELSMPAITMLPKPLASWEALATKNDYAAVIAQALYGDDFDVTMANGKPSQGGTIASIINETQKADQRYNMAMYGADHTFEGAAYAGLAYKDENVKKGEKYFYRIYAKVPASIKKLDTATIFIGLSDYRPLPKPSDVLIVFGDKSAMLSWDFETYKEYYTSYIVERSGDGGKTFIPLSDKPATTLSNTGDKPGEGSITYLDSLSNNDTTFQYRVAGVSLFGDNGPYSNIAEGKGKNMMYTTPGISAAEMDEKENYYITWQIEDSLNVIIKAFRVNQSELIEGPYKIYKDNISVVERKIMIPRDSLKVSNYFTVTAISKDGEEKTSFPYLIQPQDTVPPAVPTGLAAIVDSLGVVRLKWNANKEKDFVGYRLFKTNVKDQELIPVKDSLYDINEAIDTIDITSLNSKLYYSLKAVDVRYNQSPYSPLIEVRKPDLIPPSSPLLSNYEVMEDGIKLIWNNSPDEDVVMHNIYRKTIGNAADWVLLQSYRDKKIQAYLDKTCEPNKTYSYTIVALDSGKLESQPAIPITIEFAEKRIKLALKSLDAEVDRDARQITLSWKLLPDIKNIKQYELYRGEEKIGMSLYKIIDKEALSFIEKDLLVNTKYKYGLRVVFESGKTSDFITKNVTY